MKDSTADSGVTSPPDSKPSKKDSEQIAVTPVGTVDEDTSEGSPAPLSGTATPDELPSFPETTRSLATRWGISPSVLTRQRQRYHNRPRGFFEYSLTKKAPKPATKASEPPIVAPTTALAAAPSPGVSDSPLLPAPPSC